MTQQTMTKSEILGKVMPDYRGEPTYTISEALQAMDDFAQQEVAKERERLEELMKKEPVSFFLVNIMRNLPNEQWPSLIDALNERCSLPTKEREKAKKLVEALEEIADMTGNILIYKKAKQSLTEYEKL